MTELLEAPTASDVPANVRVRPLSGHTGAVIEGIDISKPLSEAERTLIEEAQQRWKVVFFRDQHLGHEEQIAFARQFGDLTYAHPYDNDPPEGFPEIYTVSPERFSQQYGFSPEAAKKLRKRYSYTNDWHTDVTPAINPPAASVLRAEVVPEFGGDTTFSNSAAAYEALSAPFRSFIDGLVAEHRYGANLGRKGLEGGGSKVTQANPLIAHHPVVRVHPVTGERGLFVTPGFTHHIVGLSPEESAKVLEILFAQVADPRYTVRFHWEPGSVAFWDNRITAHLGPQDIDHLDVERVLHRVTIIGEVPVGVDGLSSTLIQGEPFKSIPIFEGEAGESPHR